MTLWYVTGHYICLRYVDTQINPPQCIGNLRPRFDWKEKRWTLQYFLTKLRRGTCAENFVIFTKKDLAIISASNVWTKKSIFKEIKNHAHHIYQVAIGGVR